MKNLFFLCTTLFTLLNFNNIQAQVAADALRFSSLDVLGTARTVGVGGGLSALGADFSVINTNPAGLATFRRSEFTLTPSFHLNSTEATLDGSNGETVNENKFAFNLGNIGLVIAREGRKPNWKTSNFAIGFNRIATFQQDFTYRGSSRGSFIDSFQEASIDLAPSELSNFTTGLAFDTQALFDLEGDEFYETDVELNGDALLSKEQVVQRKGGISEFTVAYGRNYNEKLMIGIALGIPILTFTENRFYRESDPNDEVPFYRNMEFDEELRTTGQGINAKLGVIFRVNQAIRLGGAVHTPTSFNLSDDFQTRMLYDFVDGNNDGPIESSSPDEGGLFDYSLKTPWRFIGSAGFIIKQAGFLTAEVEFLRYSGAQFDLTENDNSASTLTFEENLNNEIASIYQSAINLRFGGEFVVKVLRLRAGVALTGTPYADSFIRDNPNIKGIGNSQLTYSLGLGLRQQRYFLDFGLRFATREETFFPYTLSDEFASNGNIATNSVTTNSISSHLLITFGYKF